MATTRLDDSTRYAVPAAAQRRDPRERRDQEPREALVEAVLERVGDAVMVTDAGGRTVLANEASRRLLAVGTRPPPATRRRSYRCGARSAARRSSAPR
jgi:PAS domain-containing protein